MKIGIQKDLTGQRFTYFVVLGFDHRNKFGKAMWKVKCDCGTEKVVQGNALVSGKSRSCGCAQKEWMKQSLGTGSGEMSGAFWYKVNRGAESRKHKVLITKEQASTLFDNQQHKCALSGIELNLDPHKGEITASLDRIDSSKDYQVGNVQWIHKTINKMKNNLGEEIFLDWVGKIWHHKIYETSIRQNDRTRNTE